jgi:antirestriction protein ArdC
MSGKFGSGKYALEELVAELGSCMLTAEIGIEPLWDNSAAYLAGWATALRNNPNWIISASSKASKAADFVLSKIDAPATPTPIIIATPAPTPTTEKPAATATAQLCFELV